MKHKRLIGSLISLAATAGLLIGVLTTGVAGSLPVTEADSAPIKLPESSSVIEDESDADFVISPALPSVAHQTTEGCASLSKIPAPVDTRRRWQRN